VTHLHELHSQDIFSPELDFAISLINTCPPEIYPQSHDFCEISIVLSGSLEFHIFEEVYTLNKGGIVLLDGHVPHSKKMGDESGEHLNLAFHKSSLTPLLQFWGLNFPQVYLEQKFLVETLKSNQFIEQSLDLKSLLLESTLPVEKLNLRFKNSLCRIVSYFGSLQLSEATAQPSAAPFWLQDFIQQTLNEQSFQKPMVEQLKGLPVSQAHFCREMKKHYGKTPTQWINLQRIDHAATWLKQTDKDITEIVLSSGFENISHFYHLFKKQMGISPKAYRQHHLNLY
jgi:AraC family cel operon transcriptional repressor